MGLNQGPTHRRRHTWSTLLHALDKVFQPLDTKDSSDQKEVLSMKKLDTVDCNWFNFQVLLGWVIETVNIMMNLPPHQENCFREIISAIPRNQNRIELDTWHRVLGDLHYMEIDLTRYQEMFIHMQEALRHVQGKRVVLTKIVHQDMEDLHWLIQELD